MNLRLELCWRLGQGSDARMEPRLFELLRGIEEFGSLRAATQQMKLSYRHTWALVRRWSEAFGQPLVTLERGRGAKLSVLGHKLLWAERRLTARLAPDLESLTSEVNREVASALRQQSTSRLRAVASHDLALVMLRQLLNQAGPLHLDLEFRGSLESLKLLHAKKCEVAGFHVPEGPLGARVAARYRPWLNNDSHWLIELARRDQGWMTRDNPAVAAEMPAALSQSRLRFVNRQPGSGTRLAFDQLLKDAATDPHTIQGYDTEEFTHLAVAAMIAGGAADIGLGIHGAAAQFKLHFTPAFTERYVLAVRREILNTAAVEELINVLTSQQFRQRAADMAGYDSHGAGAIIEVDRFFTELAGRR